MTDIVDPNALVPPSRRFDTVCRRANERGGMSQAPQRFYRVFQEELGTIRRKGLDAVLEVWPAWNDPVYLAAEIEALAAMRAMHTMSAGQVTEAA